MDTDILFIDFDGVICNSLDECLLSSCNAYQGLIGSLMRRQHPAEVPDEFRSKFVSLRPFARAGEDYLLINWLIENDIAVLDQADFDSWRERQRAVLGVYQEALYQERQEALQMNRRLWLSLNPLYNLTKLAKALANEKSWGNKYILTTKRKEYVMAILKHHNIFFRKDNIIFSGTEEKTDIINEFLSQKGFFPSQAVFVDDQLVHLCPAQIAGMRVFLADWGYASVQQKNKARENNIPVIDQETFCNLINS